MELIKRCLICGNPYIDNSKNESRLYCSKECRYKAGNEVRRLKKLEPKVYQVKCLKCGYEWRFDFCPRHNFKKYAEMKCPNCKATIRDEIRKAKQYEDIVLSMESILYHNR